MASSNSDFIITSKFVISLKASYLVVLCAKLAKSSFFMNKYNSFMNKLNSIGPNIKPCGALETNILIGFQSYLF